jgi:hypothetical protein
MAIETLDFRAGLETDEQQFLEELTQFGRETAVPEDLEANELQDLPHVIRESDNQTAPQNTHLGVHYDSLADLIPDNSEHTLKVLPGHVLNASIKMANLHVVGLAQASGMVTSEVEHWLQPGSGVSDAITIAAIQEALAAVGVYIGYDPDFKEKQGAGVRSPEGWLVKPID